MLLLANEMNKEGKLKGKILKLCQKLKINILISTLADAEADDGRLHSTQL